MFRLRFDRFQMPVTSMLANIQKVESSGDKKEGERIMELSVEFEESQFEKLQEKAKLLGILPKQLIKAAVTDLLNIRDEDFLSAANHVFSKNKELYKRLS